MTVHRIYLVPGFFGFAHLGGLRYWGHAHRFLTGYLDEADVEGTVHEVPTPPTASLRARARRLWQTIEATAGPRDELHLVGHSSGGLDARLLVTPGARFPEIGEVESVASRVRSIVSVATPHRGTPSAHFFATSQGQRVLQLLSLVTVYVVRWGRLPLGAVLKLADLIRRLDDYVIRDRDVIDELFDGLLSEFSSDRRDELRAFFTQVPRSGSASPRSL